MTYCQQKKLTLRTPVKFVFNDTIGVNRHVKGVIPHKDYDCLLKLLTHYVNVYGRVILC